MLPIPLIPVAMLVGEIHRERVVASYGDQAASDRMCFRFPVSDQFGTNDLWGLYETLNSETLQAPLAKYNCGDPVPKFTFRVSLIRYPIRKTDKVAVDWCYVPTLDLRDRGLDDGLMYAVEKAFARIEAARTRESGFRVLTEPSVDCSRRPPPGQPIAPFTAAGPEDWVTHPGPDEWQW